MSCIIAWPDGFDQYSKISTMTNFLADVMPDTGHLSLALQRQTVQYAVTKAEIDAVRQSLQNFKTALRLAALKEVFSDQPDQSEKFLYKGYEVKDTRHQRRLDWIAFV